MLRNTEQTMTGRRLLVVVGYVEMAAAGLFGIATLLYGPLILADSLHELAHTGVGIVHRGGMTEGLVRLKMVELGFYGIVFALGMLLVASAACVRPDSHAITLLSELPAEPRGAARSQRCRMWQGHHRERRAPTSMMAFDDRIRNGRNMAG
jgi:hypothetical protein